MRASDPEVVDAVWAAVEGLLPRRVRSHPLGCHRPRVSDRLCFRGLLVRLVTGSSWTDVEAFLERRVSDTTLRARRDEWIAAGVFHRLCAEAVAAFDKIVGLDLSEVAVDGSIHKAPCGGEGTGKSPVDRGKLGWKWSVAAERHGVPIGWAVDGANRKRRTPAGAHSRGRRRRRAARRHRDPAPRPRLRLPRRAPTTRRHRHRRRLHTTAGQPHRPPPPFAARPALDRRVHQLLAPQLRATPTQHRPKNRLPTRRPMPRHHHLDHRKTHRLEKPMEPHINRLSARPLSAIQTKFNDTTVIHKAAVDPFLSASSAASPPAFFPDAVRRSP